MKNKNISFDYSLKSYKAKYRNHSHRLLSYSKKEVEDFDKKNPNEGKDYLLKGRKWALIDERYYEIPRAPRWLWFRNLKASTQAATCFFLAAGITCTTILIYENNQNLSDEINITFKDYDGKVLEKKVVARGTDVSYKGTILPKKPIQGTEISNVFMGWDKELNNVQTDTVYHPIFKQIDKFVDNDHDGIPEGIDTDDNNNKFEVTTMSTAVTMDESIELDFRKFIDIKENSTFDKKLAKISLYCSHPRVVFKDGLFSSTVYGTRENALYSRFGCDDISRFDLNEYEFELDPHDTTDGTMAHQILRNEDGQPVRDLIYISFKGSGGVNGWSSNFDLGCKDTDAYEDKTGKHEFWDTYFHKGFYIAAKRVISYPLYFTEYIKNHTTVENQLPVVLVSGHSRGGAMANLVGLYLENECSDICVPITYAFASPRVMDATYPKTVKTDTIFNIVNTDDIVAMVPSLSWGFKENPGTTVIAKSVYDEYKDIYEKNNEGKKYYRIEGADELIKEVGCDREEMYKLDKEKEENYSILELGTYDTVDEANAAKDEMLAEYKEILGEEFCKYFNLEVEYVERWLLPSYYRINAHNCFGIMLEVIQSIISQQREFILKSSSWLPLIFNSKYLHFILGMVPDIVESQLDAVILPHDYAAYHVLINEYNPSEK